MCAKSLVHENLSSFSLLAHCQWSELGGIHSSMIERVVIAITILLGKQSEDLKGSLMFQPRSL
jgi:hypothetical protein